jgi:hypothetical protein
MVGILRCNFSEGWKLQRMYMERLGTIGLTSFRSRNGAKIVLTIQMIFLEYPGEVT